MEKFIIKNATELTPYGRFINYQGYKAPWHHNESSLIFFRKAIFEFSLDSKAPLIFEDKDGNWWMPDRHFFTDWGSIPITLQWLIPKDTYLGYLFHDSGYKHHGLWFSEAGYQKFCFKKLTMTQANELLYDMMLAQGAWKVTAITVYDTLQIAGRIAWNSEGARKRAGSQHDR